MLTCRRKIISSRKRWLKCEIAFWLQIDSVRSCAQDDRYVSTPELQAQVDLDNITFVSNERLRSVLERTGGSPQQVAEAIRINTDARLRALKIGLLIMAGLALIAIIPAGRLPDYLPGEIPNDESAAIVTGVGVNSGRMS